ncbi:MAG: diacylglycerol/lipid kinase family protein [Actinomycetota bacterium]
MISGERKLPAALIVNPNAGRAGAQERDDVVAAVEERFRVEVFTTTRRDAGIDLAADAAEHGIRLVIAYGGDGHVNEVLNGIAGTTSALGIIPGGTMNVFARALGIPRDPFAAIGHLAARAEGPNRLVNLGRMDDRYFSFSAGCGFDAECAELVERDVTNKRRFGEVFFYWNALRVLAGAYRHRNPTMVMRGPFGEIPVAMAITCNTGPYAYLAGRAVAITPEVRLEGGLDAFALKRMRIESLPLYALRSVAGRLNAHSDAVYLKDLQAFEIHSETPFHRHVDGEPLELATSARLSLAPSALRVQA